MSPQALTFDVTPGDTTRVTVPMSVVQLLDAVKVSANRSTVAASRVRSFEEHRRLGLGTIMDSTRLVGQTSMINALRMVPGLNVTSPRGGRFQISSLSCKYGMGLQLDGVPYSQEEFINLDPREIAGMEVYKSAFIFPMDVSGGNGCTIVIWTKRAFSQNR
jgi:hypothetical protein